MNCKIKYQVVMKDERESGLRELLNYGHIVGRAIETVSDYKLLHGHALSIGLVVASKMGANLGYCTFEEAEKIKSLLAKAKLPVKIPEYINREELVKKLYTDKKVKNGNLRFVFTKGIGDVMIFANEEYAKATPESFAREVIMDI